MHILCAYTDQKLAQQGQKNSTSVFTALTTFRISVQIPHSQTLFIYFHYLLFSYSWDYPLADIVHSSIIEIAGHQKPQECFEKQNVRGHLVRRSFRKQFNLQPCINWSRLQITTLQVYKVVFLSFHRYQLWIRINNKGSIDGFSEKSLIYIHIWYTHIVYIKSILVFHAFYEMMWGNGLVGGLVNFGGFTLVLFHQSGKSFTCSVLDQSV